MCVLTLSGDECVCVISYFNLCDWVLRRMLTCYYSFFMLCSYCIHIALYFIRSTVYINSGDIDFICVGDSMKLAIGFSRAYAMYM